MTHTLRASVRRLRCGIVPVDDVERLSVGYDRIRPIIDASLATLHSKGSSLPLFVRGEWGTGKSHLLEFVRATAIRKGLACAKIDLNARNAALNHPQRFYPWVAESLTIGGRRGLRSIIEAAFCEELTQRALVQFAWAPTSGKFGTALQKIILRAKIGGNDYLSDDPAWGIVMGTDLPWSDTKRSLALERFAALARFSRCIRAGGLVLLLDEVETLDQLWNRLSRLAAYETLGTICNMEATMAVFGVTRRFNQSIRHDVGYGILNDAPPKPATEFLNRWCRDDFHVIEPPMLTDMHAAQLAQRVIETYLDAYPNCPIEKDSADGAVAAWRINPSRNQRRLTRSIIDALDAKRMLEPHRECAVKDTALASP